MWWHSPSAFLCVPQFQRVLVLCWLPLQPFLGRLRTTRGHVTPALRDVPSLLAGRCGSLPLQLHLRGWRLCHEVLWQVPLAARVPCEADHRVALHLLKGETLPPELREGSPVRAGSDTNFGDGHSDAAMDQVLRFGTTA